jgi:hypothetical protein
VGGVKTLSVCHSEPFAAARVARREGARNLEYAARVREAAVESPPFRAEVWDIMTLRSWGRSNARQALPLFTMRRQSSVPVASHEPFRATSFPLPLSSRPVRRLLPPAIPFHVFRNPKKAYPINVPAVSCHRHESNHTFLLRLGTRQHCRRRDRALVTLAGVAPDVDGLGAIADMLTRNSQYPLDWFARYHHSLHNLGFALLVALAASALANQRGKAAALAFLSCHLHLLEDLIGSRGPDGYQWPIPYLMPFSRTVELSWRGQWALMPGRISPSHWCFSW